MRASSPCPPPGLRNDHKAVMKLIEEKLHQLHAETRLRRGAESEGVARGEERILPTTFARVSQVTDGSPAASAVSQTTGGHIMECALRGPQGVKAGDRIAEFGSVTAANFTGLKNVADVVQHSVGVRTGKSCFYGNTLVYLFLEQVSCKL